MKAFWIWAGKLIFAHKIIAGAAAVVLVTGVGAGAVVVHNSNAPKTQTASSTKFPSKTEKSKTEKSSSLSSSTPSSSSTTEQSSVKESNSADTTAETPKAPAANNAAPTPAGFNQEVTNLLIKYGWKNVRGGVLNLNADADNMISSNSNYNLDTPVPKVPTDRSSLLPLLIADCPSGGFIYITKAANAQGQNGYYIDSRNIIEGATFPSDLEQYELRVAANDPNYRVQLPAQPALNEEGLKVVLQYVNVTPDGVLPYIRNR